MSISNQIDQKQKRVRGKHAKHAKYVLSVEFDTPDEGKGRVDDSLFFERTDARISQTADDRAIKRAPEQHAGKHASQVADNCVDKRAGLSDARQIKSHVSQHTDDRADKRSMQPTHKHTVQHTEQHSNKPQAYAYIEKPKRGSEKKENSKRESAKVENIKRESAKIEPLKRESAKSPVKDITPKTTQNFAVDNTRHPSNKTAENLNASLTADVSGRGKHARHAKPNATKPEREIEPRTAFTPEVNPKPSSDKFTKLEPLGNPIKSDKPVKIGKHAQPHTKANASTLTHASGQSAHLKPRKDSSCKTHANTHPHSKANAPINTPDNSQARPQTRKPSHAHATDKPSHTSVADAPSHAHVSDKPSKKPSHASPSNKQLITLSKKDKSRAIRTLIIAVCVLCVAIVGFYFVTSNGATSSIKSSVKSSITSGAEATVTFDSQGGSAAHFAGSATISATVRSGNTYGSATFSDNNVHNAMPTTEKTGYKFLGWFTQAEGGSQVSANTQVEEQGDHTLYAHWARETLYF